jgi:hypothetical protein
MAWAGRLSWREQKEFLPRDEDGEVRLLHTATWRAPEPAIKDAERYLAQGKSVMFLTTCAFMLEPLKHALRRRGLPFANPYRLKRHDWNPLGISDPVSRLRAFLRPWLNGRTSYSNGDSHSIGPRLQSWNAETIQRWAEWLKANVFEEGARERLIARSFRGLTDLASLLAPEPFEQLNLALSGAGSEGLAGAIDWWLDHLSVEKRKRVDYQARVVLNHGVDALTKQPQIMIGTAHSVKGGEGDVVYVFPDLSVAGAREWEGRPNDRDGIVRLAYVMITRARESLILCEPAGPGYMPLDVLARRELR